MKKIFSSAPTLNRWAEKHAAYIYRYAVPAFYVASVRSLKWESERALLTGKFNRAKILAEQGRQLLSAKTEDIECMNYQLSEYSEVNIKTDYKQYLILGFLLLLMSLTRSIGYAALAVIVIYFILEKKWMQIVYSVSSFLLFFFSFQGLKSLIWSTGDVQFETQANSLLLKN